MNVQTKHFSSSLKYVKPVIFWLGITFLLGTWIILYWNEALFTESHLVGYYCCVLEQDLPATGTFERIVNDFFRYSPGKHLPSVTFVLINVSLFIATMSIAREKYWLPFLFIFFNIIYVTIDLELITVSWFISDWLVGPQTTVYKGYHRTGYGIVLHLTLWSTFFITIWKIKASIRRSCTMQLQELK